MSKVTVYARKKLTEKIHRTYCRMQWIILRKGHSKSVSVYHQTSLGITSLKTRSSVLFIASVSFLSDKKTALSFS